jgi:hypothetical protein
VVRVGDEHDVELLVGRLPNATSAAAVVDGRLAEVEGAANNAGNFVRIRILDVDDTTDRVLAELVTAGAKPRRKRRGRAEISAAEQTRQLRELAEDAARQSASRPPIGISSITEEEEAADKTLSAERRGEAQPDAIIIAEGAVQHTASDGGRKRRRRRRGGRGRSDGEKSVAMTPPVEVVPAAEAPVSGDGAGGHRRRRRRRRGRGGRGGGGSEAAAMPDRHIFEVASDGAAHPTGATAPPEPSRAIATVSATPPAVEPPPRSLSAPPEEIKSAKPTRRRRTPRPQVAGELEGVASAIALPAAEPEAKPRRTRKPKATTAEAEPKAKPVRKRKAATTAPRRRSPG